MKVNNIVVLVLMFLTFSLGINAQGNGRHGKRLSQERFVAELEKFIASEADLTPQECNKLFPIMREMYGKQRLYFDKLKQMHQKCPKNESDCRNAVKQRDKIDLDMKKLQQTYHNKMLDAISPCKVMMVLNAEDKFHRAKLKDWSRKGNKN